MPIYDGQTITDLDVTKPVGGTEQVFVLDDVAREIKRAMTQTGYDWCRLTNKAGSPIVAGDVMALSSANDAAVVQADVENSLRPYVVAAHDIAADAVGIFARSGVVTTRVSGACARLDFLRKSDMTRALETTGVNSASTDLPPIGAIGLALAPSAAGGLVAVLLFRATVAAATGLQTYLTVLDDRASLPNSRRLVAGAGVNLIDASGTLTIEAGGAEVGLDLNEWLTWGDVNTMVRTPAGYVYISPASGQQLEILGGGIVLPSGQALQGRDLGGTARQLIGMASDNNIYIGQTPAGVVVLSAPVYLAQYTITFAALDTRAGILLNNSTYLTWRDAGGAGVNLLSLLSDNQFYIGDSTHNVILRQNVFTAGSLSVGAALTVGQATGSNVPIVRARGRVAMDSQTLLPGAVGVASVVGIAPSQTAHIRVTWTTPFADTNYFVVIAIETTSAAQPAYVLAKTTTTCDIWVQAVNAVAVFYAYA